MWKADFEETYGLFYCIICQPRAYHGNSNIVIRVPCAVFYTVLSLASSHLSSFYYFNREVNLFNHERGLVDLHDINGDVDSQEKC